ncbi:hypothetical protein D3C84_662560 [compost metagenome]
MARQFPQPGIEIIDCVEAEGEAQQVFAPTARQPGEELFEAFQQVELTQRHVHRQTRAQLSRQLKQPGAQQVGVSFALFGTLRQQGLHINHQHNAVECPAAAVARQPIEQVRPKARMGAIGQYRFDLALLLDVFSR